MTMRKLAGRVALFVLAGVVVMGADAAGVFQPQPQNPNYPRFPGQPERPDRPDQPFTPQDQREEEARHSAKQEVCVATSDDGVKFTERKDPLMKKAGSPDVLVLERDLAAAGAPGTRQGDALVYVSDGRHSDKPGSEKLARLFSSDGGETWSGARSVEIFWPNMQARGVIREPSVVQLEDGRLRMYYYLENAKGVSTPNHAIGSAISMDGVKFTPEDGHRLELEGVTAPEVIRVGAEWMMFTSRGGRTALAKSGDGLVFTEEPSFKFQRGGGLGAALLADERVRLYFTDVDGVGSSVWNRENGRFETESGLRLERRGRDAAVFPRASGGYFAVFSRPSK
jgi:hypothetical protein